MIRRMRDERIYVDSERTIRKYYHLSNMQRRSDNNAQTLLRARREGVATVACGCTGTGCREVMMSKPSPSLDYLGGGRSDCNNRKEGATTWTWHYVQHHRLYPQQETHSGESSLARNNSDATSISKPFDAPGGSVSLWLIKPFDAPGGRVSLRFWYP